VLFLLFLIIGHWVIMLGVVIVSEPAFRQLTGLPPLTDDDQRSGYSVFTAIVLSIALTWLAFKPVKKFSKPVSSNALERQELLGDILLIAGVSLLSFVVWEKSLVEAMTQMDADSFGQLFALFIFLALCYLLFYLPLRYLYLIEERSGRQAWKRLLLVFMIILLRGLFAAWQR
jgi:RsiW-degrading membrane proteinase PrsW (M82 family)